LSSSLAPVISTNSGTTVRPSTSFPSVGLPCRTGLTRTVLLARSERVRLIWVGVISVIVAPPGTPSIRGG